MIKGLSKEQEKKLFEYRERYFNQATSVEPADRCRSEAAGRRLAEIAGVRCESVHWVQDPSEGASLWASLRSSLSDSIMDSLSASIMSSLTDSLSDLLWDSLRSSLSDSLLASLSDSLSDSLRSSLSASIMSSLSASLSDLLWESLSDSISDSLWDTGWLAYYSYAVEELVVKIDEKARELLYLHNEIAASCFAIWIVPGALILCERPEYVDIKYGKVVSIKWRKQEQ